LHPPLTQAEIQKSLKYSLGDGVFWSITVGFAEIYFSPFYLFLGASHLVFGILTTLPLLIGSISQLATASWVKRIGSRKMLVLFGVGAQGLLLLMLGIVPSLGALSLGFCFLITTLYWTSWMNHQPAWQSWMGELVPQGIRGRYFAERNRLIQLVTFLSLVAAGWILNEFQKIPSQTAYGFLLLFTVGALGRVLSGLAIGRQKDLPILPEKETSLSIRQFLQKISHTPFGRFVLFSTLFAAAINLSAPYFIAYLLEGLRFSYLQFMILMAVMAGAKYFFLPLWGRFSDRHGSQRLFILSSLLSSLLPFLWLPSSHFNYLILVHLYAGAVWGGFELCSFQFLLDATAPENRTRLAAYYETLTGVGMVIGGILGGWLLKSSLLGAQAYLVLFFLSGIVRMGLSLGFLGRIREVK